MEATIRRPAKRSIFDQAGLEPKRVSKFNEKLFSRSPPASPKTTPKSLQPNASSLDPGSLIDSSLSQKRTDNEPIADTNEIADPDIFGIWNQQKGGTGSAMGIPDEQVVAGPQIVPFPMKLSEAVDIQDVARDAFSEPAQGCFIISKALKEGERIH